MRITRLTCLNPSQCALDCYQQTKDTSNAHYSGPYEVCTESTPVALHYLGILLLSFIFTWQNFSDKTSIAKVCNIDETTMAIYR